MRLFHSKAVLALSLSLAATGVAVLFSGCASAKVDVLTRPQANITRPDFILVQNLAVTPDEVELDRGAVAKSMRDSDKKAQDEMEVKIGHAAAQAFTDELVNDLRKAGIRAAKTTDGYKPTASTLVIKGKFAQISQGNQTTRVLIGFGFGNGDIKAMVEAYQNDKLIAKAMVTTSGGHKPGLLVPVAGGAAAGTAVASAAVSGGATVMSESFSATVQADAQRAAKEVAKKLVQGYINHQWASPEALDKINGLF